MKEHWRRVSAEFNEGKAGVEINQTRSTESPGGQLSERFKNKNKRVAFEDEDEADDESEEEAPAPACIGPPTSRKIRELPYVNVPSLTPVVQADRQGLKKRKGLRTLLVHQSRKRNLDKKYLKKC